MLPSAAGRKQTMLLILFAYVMLVILLTFVSTTIPGGSVASSAAIWYVIGGAAFVVSVALSLTQLSAEKNSSPNKLQVSMLICLAVAELTALMGFVGHLSSGLAMWPFSVLSVGVILALILPRVLNYWRANGESGPKVL